MLKFPAPYFPVLTKISKCHIFLQIALYSRMTSYIFIIKFDINRAKTVGEVAF